MDVFEAFDSYLHTRYQSADTIRGYSKVARHFARWFEQTKTQPFALQAVTPTDVSDYCHMESIKRTTANRRFACLSVLMRWATDTRLIEQDPAQECEHVYQYQPRSVKYLDKEQQLALYEAIERDLNISRLRYPIRWRSHQRNASLVIFLLHTGLRVQEAANLCWSNLTIIEQHGEVHIQKGSKQRVVPLNTEACKALQDWLSVRPSGKSEYVWEAVENEQYGALTSRSVQRVIKRIGQDAGLSCLTPQTLRHTFAKNLVDCGVGLEKVAALLGTSTRSVLIYFHGRPKLKDLVQAVEQLTVTIGRRSTSE